MNFVLTRRDPLRVDTALRQLLLDYRLDRATSAELNDWLLQIGEPLRGRVHERILRIREHASYLDMACEEFPAIVLGDLERYTLDELADLCHLLGLPSVDDRDTRTRHILGAVLRREGWLPEAEVSSVSEGAAPQWHLVPLIDPGQRRGCTPDPPRRAG